MRLSYLLLSLFISRLVIAADPAAPDFASVVRPILSNHCYQCHGPDDEGRGADLRLDTRDGIHSVLNPGDPSESELLQRILADDEELQMPPAEANKALSTEQKQILQEWVRSGADWQQHWAFVRPQRPQIPADSTGWSRNEIDRLALSRMQKAGLEPSAEADPYVLIKRLYLDLTGLPPSPEEADRWLQRIWPDVATSPGSLHSSWRQHVDETGWQELVDHLLASPAWGERWARRWLDLARYADTNGYEKDRDRSIWPYRDWVINALNSDMPFDQFTIEQLAGDMLPQATQQQNIATGFHRNTMLNEEGGIDPLEFRFHAMTDRVATTGTTWLGLTMGCAQCHTHKYDPISHREYYGLMAFLNNADEPTLQLTSDATRNQNLERQRQAEEQLKQLEQQWPLTDQHQDKDRPQLVNQQFAKWLQEQREQAVVWQDVRPNKVSSTLPILTIEDDGSVFASGDTAKRDEYHIHLPPRDTPVTAIQLEALPDDRLPARGPGSTYYEGTIGDFFLNELQVRSGEKVWPVAAATETYARDRYGKPSGSALTIDGDVQTGWSVHERQGERHAAVYQLQEPIPPGTPLEVHLIFGRHFASSLGRFRFSVTDATHRIQASPLEREIQQLLTKAADQISEQQKKQLRRAFLLQAPELTEAATGVRDLLKPVPVPTTLVLRERAAGFERPTFRHHRGEYLSAREQVEPTTLSVLHPRPEGSPANRLTLARWLVDPANPLTPRVVVNRHWAALFGTGLVRTVGDFGLQGEFPSHPQLLDWLAVSFVEDDHWSLKKLHRRIVSSSLYRQSAAVNAAAEQIDPGNRLLSYAPRFRLDAEIVRDRLLKSAGVYHAQVGGPSVFPPQPGGVQDAAYRKGSWEVSTGGQKYRRSLYTFAKRTSPFAMLSTFDAPSGESCIARRSRSNNPLQALTLLNDVMFTDLARQAGQRITELDLADEAKLVRLFRQVLVRPPTLEEQQMLRDYQSRLRRSLTADPERATQLNGDDTAPAPEAGGIELAVWTGTARILFALDETVTRE